MISDQIARWLLAKGLVDYRPDAVGGDCFIEDLPAQPDAAVGIYTTPGPPADVKLGYDSPGFQIVARALTSLAAVLKLAAIYAELHGLHNQTLADGIWLVGCEASQSSATRLGRDRNGRHQYSLNFTAEVRAPTTHRE